MKWARSATCVALVAVLTYVAACGSFGAAAASGAEGGADASDTGDAEAGDAAASCVPETCPIDAGPSCFFDDFGAACPPEITFSGNTGEPGVVGECSGGKLHVAARNTLDLTARFVLPTPDTYDSIRVSFGLAVVSWDAGSVLRLGIDNTVVASLDVAKVKTGNPAFALCGEAGLACIAPAFEAKAGEVHRFTFVITSTSVALSVDCRLLATRVVGTKLGPGATLDLELGRVDATLIDGTLDDLGVSFP